MAINRIVSVPFEMPEEVLLHIFSHFTGVELERYARVCQQWNRVAKDDTFWKPIAYRSVLKNALGKRVWEMIGRVGDEPSFTSGGEPLAWRDVCKTLKNKGPSRTPFLIPKTINGKPTTINLVMELLRTARMPTQFEYIDPRILARYGNIPVEKSYWCDLDDTVVEGTRQKPPAVRAQLITERGQKLPRIIEQIFFIVLGYQDGRPCGYGRSPWTYGQCSETIEVQGREFPVFVGAFAPAAPGSPGGLSVFCFGGGYENLGAGGLRKF